MPSSIKTLRSEQHIAIGDLIERSIGELIDRWKDRAKEEQSKAKRVHHDILVDHLPVFLATLGRSLASAGDNSHEPQREAVEHGDQRWEQGWSISEVVRDYQILRMVLIEFLEDSLIRRLSVRELLVLNVAIDDAIAAAVAAYVASQNSPGIAATRNEAVELLLSVLGQVGHELRNPLGPLTNSVEILRLAGSDPVHVESSRQMISRQVQLLTRLVDDLMDVPRLARGKMSIVRERIDLAQLIKTCAEDRRLGMESAGLVLNVDAPPTPVWIIGDEARLTQTFGNLLTNAQKYTDRGGMVGIRLSVPGDTRAVVSIQDTGIGIDAAMLPKIFEAYTQADQPVNRRRGGLGLGLALVKGVVQLHGGSVSATSDGPGKGTTFTVELPLAESPNPSAS